MPGLAAKPTVDIMPGLRSLDDAAPLIPLLERIGYAYVPEYERPNAFDEGDPHRRYFRKDNERSERAFHMHMVETSSDFWRRQLLFRDWLRTHAADAAAYAALKRDLAARFNDALTPESNVNLGYTDNKTGFVEGVLAKAEAALRIC